MLRWGDGESGRLGEGEMERLSDGEIEGRNGTTAQRHNGAMAGIEGRWFPSWESLSRLSGRPGVGFRGRQKTKDTRQK
ncbi:MAG: hypothetical protein A2X05_02995 [Bacteroidetes bacterium GWE2_41_25]|nr:MAG: hypothetical protein A2X03_05885 [Bacteroidetes bacterium GWA2_40_15]OFX91700.1 MAG: hypothetical protein A2X05_02995 [Bacteroidetes bacterium GWE2_41_25]OFX97607.1 MAG: hypothetical protein A2X06_17460 [Bacteroidetes bacterium GWC2_40_22]OFY56932.1 MAG: hypothetical protein A2X04_11235 [Bacteroidetes bacterium GWF2_41_9]